MVTVRRADKLALVKCKSETEGGLRGDAEFGCSTANAEGFIGRILSIGTRTICPAEVI